MKILSALFRDSHVMNSTQSELKYFSLNVSETSTRITVATLTVEASTKNDCKLDKVSRNFYKKIFCKISMVQVIFNVEICALIYLKVTTSITTGTKSWSKIRRFKEMLASGMTLIVASSWSILINEVLRYK